MEHVEEEVVSNDDIVEAEQSHTGTSLQIRNSTLSNSLISSKFMQGPSKKRKHGDPTDTMRKKAKHGVALSDESIENTTAEYLGVPEVDTGRQPIDDHHAIAQVRLISPIILSPTRMVNCSNYVLLQTR